MLKQRLILLPKCLINKQISNIIYPCSMLPQKMLLFNGNGRNARFLTGRAVERPFIYQFLCPNKAEFTKKPLLTTFNKRGIVNRLYSGDPSVTFLSGGKSKDFKDNATYDADRLLHNVIGQLKEDNGVDICVIETSEERKKYADYVIVVSGRSTRHLKAMTNHIHQQSKKDFREKNVIVSGLDSDDWMIVDFGSIVIHLFLPEVREKYELEKLWSLGPEHDEQYQSMLEDDRYAEMFKNAKLDDFFVKEDS